MQRLIRYIKSLINKQEYILSLPLQSRLIASHINSIGGNK
jgi:hypothetical protein